MWTKSNSKMIKGITKQTIWNRWSDVNTWHEWMPGVESCELKKPFAKGNHFTLKPKGAAPITVQLVEVQPEEKFTGRTRFFGATLYDTHEIQETADGLKITVTLKVEGPLGFLWRLLVVGKIASNLPTLLKNLATIAGASPVKKEAPDSKSDKAKASGKKTAPMTTSSKQAKPSPSPVKKTKAKTSHDNEAMLQDDLKTRSPKVTKGKRAPEKETGKKETSAKKTSPSEKPEPKAKKQPKKSSLKTGEPSPKKTKSPRKPKPKIEA